METKNEVSKSVKIDDSIDNFDGLNASKESQMIDDEEYYKLDDDELKAAIFTKENVQHFLLYQKSVELIGFVDKPTILPTLFKFDLSNKIGSVIQVLIYEKAVKEKYKSFLEPGAIVHVDGAFVNKKHSLSKGNIEYDLIVGTNTIIRLMKKGPKYIPAVATQTNVSKVTIEDSVKCSGKIQIEAWLKQKIAEESLPNENIINRGCLSDCQKYKLELRMQSLDDMTNFVIGSHVVVTGVIMYAPHAYISVARKTDIELVSNEIKTVGQLLKGATIPKRPLSSVNGNTAKKFCTKM